MGRFTIILLVVFIQGCSATAKYYMPEHGSGTVHLHPDANCTVPSASYQFDLADGVNGYVSASVGADGWGVSYGFNLPKGSELQVADPTISIRIIESGEQLNLRMETLVLSVYGGLPDRPAGYHKNFAPDAILFYTGLNERLDADYLQYDTFRSGVHVPGLPPMEFEFKLPDLLVNGNVVQSHPVRLRYVEQRYRDACIQ
jgi:hypothetical protein